MKISKRILKKINGKIVKKVLADEKMIFIIDFYEKVLESLMSSTENIPNEPQIGPIYKTSGKLIDILIVDDIEFNLEVLKKMIGGLYGTCPCKMPHRPYSLHSAKSGKEAIEKVKYQNSIEGGYRIIVMDCLMPEIDGWEAAKLIKEMYEKNEISVLPCIIAYSAFNSKEDVDKSKLSGMSTHLVKPCTAEELCITIRKWMN